MEEEKLQAEEEMETKADIDWENRTLCSDENCIGVIGPEGRCKECGKTYEGSLNVAESPSEAAADNDEAEADEAGFAAEDNTVAGEEEAAEEEAAEEDPDWETRTLCSDGNCIGVIGSDGRCAECGKSSGG